MVAAFVLCAALPLSLPAPADVARLAPPKSFLPAGKSAPFVDGGRAVDPGLLEEEIKILKSQCVVTCKGTRGMTFEISCQVIKERMRAQLEAGTQVGMAVAVYYRGRQVAHVCGGMYRCMGGKEGEWQAVDPNTLFMSYSVCKGVAAAGLMTCVDRGECAYTDAVAAKWPEFAQGSKADVSIAQAVSHRAGLPGLRPSFLPVVGAHLAALSLESQLRSGFV
jgi:CubicO group peptidase (beta-lactamase class C family)